MKPPTPIAPAALANELIASRARSIQITHDLRGEQLFGPKLAIVNPPLWEIGHLAWFQEHWCLRYRGPDSIAESILPGADALYDSAKVAHDSRWDLPLPDLAQTRAYQTEVLERVLRRLEPEPENAGLQYFVQLAIFHEDMHAEAFHYTRQTLGYVDPFPANDTTTASNAHTKQDIELPGGPFMLGAPAGDAFVFDNEKWAHEVRVVPFRIARTPVTNAEYLEFVGSGGYLQRKWWSDEGWTWRAGTGSQAPCYWVRQGQSWQQRRFDRTIPLQSDHPVIHVNWHEAQAYCRYAQRRLPTEAEWEYAAAWDASAGKKRRYPWGDAPPVSMHANLEGGDVAGVDAYSQGDTVSGCRQMLGNVWEWTQSTFTPYPGFVIDPYKEYSQPWFENHKVLRGGSFATTRRLIRNTWRNFYTPGRNDIFAGFRTCALDN